MKRAGASTESSIPATPVTLVVGKGGVGKTTVSRALAAAHARSGFSTVRLSVDGVPGDGAVRDGAASDGAAADADAGVGPRGTVANHADERPWREVSLDWDSALMAAAADVFGSARAARAMLGNFAMRRLMRVLPGVREYSLLLASYAWRDRADRVVLDMPATGHGLAWIDTVKLATRLFPSGRIHDRAVALLAALRDPAATAMVLVTVAEPVVSSESRELRAGVQKTLGVPPALTVVNLLDPLPECTDEDLTAALQACPSARGDIDRLRAWIRQRQNQRTLAARNLGPTILIERAPRDPVAAAARALEQPGPLAEAA